MYNHTITRLAYWPIFFIMFVSGICTGSIIGLAFGLMNLSSVGIFGGTFIAFLTGLSSGFIGLIYTAVFNTLAPAIGGIVLVTLPLPEAAKKVSELRAPDSPSH